MVTDTATAFVLIGAALALLVVPAPRWRRLVGRSLAAIVLGMGAVTLLTYAGLPIVPPELFVPDAAGARGSSIPGLAAPETAVAFILAGASLLLLDVETRRGRRPAEWFVLGLAAIAMTVFFGYYGLAFLVATVLPFTGMAVNTAVAFMLLGAGILAARPDRGFMSRLTSGRTGGVAARRLVVTAFWIPLVGGALVLAGVRAGLYGVAPGFSLFAALTAVSFTLLALRAARVIERHEARLERSEEKFRAVVEGAPDAMLLVDRHGMITLANERIRDIFGYEPSALLGERVEALVPMRARTAHREHRLAYEKDPRARPMGAGLTLSAVKADGTEFPVEISLSPIITDDGMVTAATIRDITERERTQRDLRGWAQFFQHAQFGVVLGGGEPEDAVFEAVNPAFARMHGWAAEELIGRPVASVFAPEVRSTLPAEIAKAHVTGHHAFESLHVRKDGSVFPVLVDITAVRDEEGRVRFRAVAVLDITERKAAEENIARLAAIVESSVDGILTKDTRGIITSWNRACERIFGYTEDEIVGKKIRILYPPDRMSEEDEIVQTVIVGGESVAIHETERLCKDGSRICVALSLSPLRSADGRVVGAASIVRDVTERKKAEEAERRLAVILQATPDFVGFATPDGRTVFVNEAGLRMTGYTAEEATAMHISRFATPRSWEIINSEVIPLAVRNGSSTAETTFVTRSGQEIPMLQVIIAHKSSDGKLQQISTIARDITVVKRAEAELRTQARLLRETQILAKVGGWRWDVVSKRVVRSEELRRVIGDGPSFDDDPASFVAGIHPDDRARVVEAARTSISTGQPLSLDLRLLAAGGKSRWLHVHGEVELDAGGQVVALHGTAQDITERKVAEEALAAALREKESLLREIHHRVKNNLQVISSLLAMQSDYATERTPKELLLDSRNRVKSMALVHERLYRSGDLRHVNVGRYLADLSRQVFGSTETGDRVRLTVETEDVLAQADTAVSCGLIVNELISNSLKHGFPEGRRGNVRVRVSRDVEGYLTLAVADDGVGLPPGFDAAEQRSMGMQIVVGLAGQLGAKLEVGKGPGAQFSVRFPLDRAEGP